jgi:hypothetical protein
MDLYYTLFGTNKPVCLMEEQMAEGREELFSRRKSPLTTREGVEEFKIVRLHVLVKKHVAT